VTDDVPMLVSSAMALSPITFGGDLSPNFLVLQSQQDREH